MKRAYLPTIMMVLVFVMAALSSCSGNAEPEKDAGKGEKTPEEAVKALEPGDGIYAVIETSMGQIICKLFPDKAPIGVENFVGLAEGTKEFTDPKTGKKTKRRYYDGLTFHRVIPDFMVQGGDPLGTGTGGPGFKFKNEVSKDLSFDQPGRLAYANAGPDTNGSQFFITHKATPWLNGGYTIFGQAIKGQDVVDAMGAVSRNKRDAPLDPIYMNSVSIVRIKSN